MIFLYEQLKPNAKQRARAEVLQIERDAVARLISSARQIVKTDLHRAINDSHISIILNRLAFVNRISVDVTRLERVITENLCHFKPNGAYITYILR